MQLEGKRVVLTGAASGVGRQLLAQLANYDLEIVAADRDAERLGESVRLPQNVRASINPFVCDLSTKHDTDDLFAHALATMNGVDLFIANAGFAYYERLQEADWQHIADIYNVNVFSPFYAVVRMAELNPDNPYTVVMTSSTVAHWGIPGYALYSSTKAALHRFADAYRGEMPANGNLMLVYPVGTRTDFYQQAGAPKPFPIQDPDVVARAIIRGILQNSAAVYPSVLWQFSSAINRVFPIVKPIAQWVYRRTLNRTELTQQRDNV